MATKKYIELQEFSAEELANELKETEKHYQKIKLDHAIKGLEQTHVIKEVRRDISRMKSEVRRRELAGMSAEDLANRSRIRHRRRNK